MSVNKRRSNFQGLTLIEILIAMVMTLIVLGAMMYAFRYASQEITKGRATMELSNQLIVVQEMLRSDLDGVTVDVRPWSKTASPNGYFEYLEGAGSDKTRLDFDNNGVVDAVRADGVIGDIDDVLALTVRSRNRPFRGRWFNGTTTEIVESNVAEVIWWTTWDNAGTPGYNDTITLHRRVLLVRPDLLATLNTTPTALGMTPGVGQEVKKFFLQNDISARPADLDADGDLETMIPNSLADLAKRENRFAHLWIEPGSNTFPHQLSLNLLTQFSITEANIQDVDATVVPTLTAENPDISTHIGDDIVISDVVGFDLQIYSPDTPVMADGGLVFEPDDVHYVNATTQVEQGAFVDLAYNRVAFGTAGQPAFATFPAQVPSAALDLNYVETWDGKSVNYFVFDTYSTHYESDGIDQDGGVADEANNGVDDDGANGVDDNGERETLPPYPDRALGFKASVRVVERDTKQVRQTEIIASFVPQ
jgi:type II secretory pathway pseudopilin PulG